MPPSKTRKVEGSQWETEWKNYCKDKNWISASGIIEAKFFIRSLLAKERKENMTLPAKKV